MVVGGSVAAGINNCVGLCVSVMPPLQHAGAVSEGLGSVQGVRKACVGYPRIPMCHAMAPSKYLS